MNHYPQFGGVWANNLGGGFQSLRFQVMSAPAVVVRNSLFLQGASVAWNGQEWGVFWGESQAPAGQYFQRIGANGIAIGSPVRVSDKPGMGCDAAWNGSEYALVWGGTTATYLARVDSAGNRIGDDVALSGVGGVFRKLSIVWTGAEYLVVWSDGAVMFRRVGPLGVPIGTGPGTLSAGGVPKVAWTGAEYAVNNGSGAIYRLDALGGRARHAHGADERG